MFQEVCSNPPPEGFAIPFFDMVPLVNVSCDVTLRCAQNIFTKGFMDFHRNASDNLRNVVNNFKTDFIEMSNIFFSMSDRMDTDISQEHFNSCLDNLDLYTGFSESFYDLVDYFNQTLDLGTIDVNRFTVVTRNFLDYVDKPNERAKRIKEDILKNCFWFEQYFWWRHTRLSNCYGNFMTTGIQLEAFEVSYVAELEAELSMAELDNKTKYLLQP